MDSAAAVASSAPPDAGTPGQIISNRYAVDRRLGSGGMGAVLLVRDRLAADCPLALKLVRRDRLDARGIRLLRNEFRALARLHHPGVTRVRNFGVDDESGDVYFTTEFVDGVDWLKAVERLDLAEQEDLDHFLELLVQVLRALEFIHSRGFVHGDIKPDNILIANPDGRAPKVKLIDFGLVRREREKGGKKILGTPYYVAPETILGSPMDRRTDLYSLGVVLYHLLTGRPPFIANTNLSILKSHVEGRPAPLRKLVPSLPSALEKLVLRLMEKSPEKRFQSALEVCDSINSGFGKTYPLETTETFESYLHASRLVGREWAFDRLKQLFLAVVRPGSLLSRIRAQNGGGSLPVDDGDAPAAADLDIPGGRMVLLRREKIVEEDALIDCFRGEVETHGIVWTEIRASAAGDSGVDELRRLIDELARLPSASPDGLPPRYLACGRRLVATLSAERVNVKSRAVLGELQEYATALLEHTRRVPIVLHLDRVHQAGTSLARLVETVVGLQAADRVSGCRLLVVGTVAATESSAGGEFARLLSRVKFREQLLEISLPRLDPRTVERLVRETFGGVRFPVAFAERIHRESDGQTEVVREILDFLLTEGKLRRLPRGWSLSRDFESVELPGKALRELEESLDRLPERALELGIALACMKRVCLLEVGAAVAGIAPRSVHRHLTALVRERVLEPATPAAASGSHTFVRQSVRDALYARVEPERRPALHARVGTLLEEHFEAARTEDPRELAHHFLQSVDHDRGIRYGLDAARAHAREHAPAQAIDLYERVLTICDGEDRELVRRVQRELAALRMHIGDYEGVLELLEPLASEAITEEPEDFRSRLQLVHALGGLGRFEVAEERLAELETRDCLAGGDERPLAVALAKASLAVVRGRWVESLRLLSDVDPRAEELADVRTRVRLWLLLAESRARLDDRDGAAGYCQRAVRLIEAQHDAELLSLGLFARGKYHAFRHRYGRALKQFRLCLVLRGRRRDYDGQADCLLEIGQLEMRLGRPHQARPSINKSLAVYRRTGNVRGTVSSLCALGDADRLLGDYEGSRTALRDALRRSRPLDDPTVSKRVLVALAAGCGDRGDVGSARRYLDQAALSAPTVPDAGGFRAESLRLRGEWAFRHGDFSTSLQLALRAADASRETRRPDLLALSLAFLGEVYLVLHDASKVRRTIASLMDVAQRHGVRVCEGHARLLEARLLAREGDLTGAATAFALVTDLYGADGCERDLANLYLEYGVFCLGTGDDEQAYLNLQEGFFLGKKLDLSWLKCRLHFARGMLEAKLATEQLANADEHLRIAARMAKVAGFRFLYSAICTERVGVLERQERDDERVLCASAGQDALDGVLRDLPETHRERFSDRVGMLAAR